jgi:hypothetical protein
MKQRSQLRESRPSYLWECGICGKEINGKSNTIHLAILSHIRAEYKKGKRNVPYSRKEHGDSGRKFY